jgi:hypothetical protein
MHCLTVNVFSYFLMNLLTIFVDLGHPLYHNVRAGNWLFEYIVKRLDGDAFEPLRHLLNKQYVVIDSFLLPNAFVLTKYVCSIAVLTKLSTALQPRALATLVVALSDAARAALDTKMCMFTCNCYDCCNMLIYIIVDSRWRAFGECRVYAIFGTRFGANGGHCQWRHVDSRRPR